MKLYIRTLNPLVTSMYLAGRTTYEIAEVFGVTHVAVWKALKENGVKRRPCGPIPSREKTAA